MMGGITLGNDNTDLKVHVKYRDHIILDGVPCDLLLCNSVPPQYYDRVTLDSVVNIVVDLAKELGEDKEFIVHLESLNDKAAKHFGDE